MIASLALPRVMRLGAGASNALAEVLSSFGLSRPLIVTDSYLLTTGRVETLLAPLRTQGITCHVFAGTVPEPTLASIEAGLSCLQTDAPDCVVGFGGGSPIDTAKALAVLAVHGGRMRDYMTPHIQDAPGLPVIAIPTTAGTGSEATRFTIITDEAVDEKMLCIGLAYLPIAALVDFELTLTMPPRLTADTGIDALTHAIEAYVSRQANAFSDGFALQAMRAIAPNLPRVSCDPGNLAARERIMLGSTLAGIAFSNSSVALVHGMSRPIGAHFHVPHGLSNAMLLPIVTAYSAPAAVERYAACARAMEFAGDDDTDEGAVERLIAALERLNSELQVPSPQAYGIDEARWVALAPTMAEQALASGSPGNNPAVPTSEQIIDLYRRAWSS